MDKNINLEIIDSIASENLSSTAQDFAEIALDSLLEDGILRDIPIFNALISLYRSGVQIRQQLFFRKIVNFLKELSEISIDERRKFVDNINDSQKNNFGETLILLIDHANNMYKPTILGRLLKNHILGNLSYQDTERLAFIVDRVYLSDLNYLKNFTSGVQENPNIAASLFSAGLLANIGVDGGGADEKSPSGIIYTTNRYGNMLLEFGLKEAEKET